MFIFGANIEQIAAGNTVGTVIEDMQAVAAPDQHQLAKFVGMLSKNVLRITIRHRNGLCGTGEKLVFSKD